MWMLIAHKFHQGHAKTLEFASQLGFFDMSRPSTSINHHLGILSISLLLDMAPLLVPSPWSHYQHGSPCWEPPSYTCGWEDHHGSSGWMEWETNGLGSLEKHPLRYLSVQKHRNFSCFISRFCNILAPGRSTKISGFTMAISPLNFQWKQIAFLANSKKISGWNPKLYMSNMLDILFNPTGLWVVSIFDFSRYAAMVSRLFQQL